MAVGMLLKLPDGTAEFYDRVMDELDWKGQDFPPGFISHYAGPLPSGGWFVFDVWDSQADFERFAQDRLMGAMTRAMDGGEPPQQEPKFIPIHNEDHAKVAAPA